MESKRVMVYAHYNENGGVRPYVHESLKGFREVCGRNIIFVSNSPISEEDRDRLSPLCSAVLTRTNCGYDFSMWKMGLERLNLSDWDEVVLLNCSVLGPLTPVEDLFESMRSVECDFWGMTESYELKYHIQSYFFVFRKNILTSRAFGEFWNSVLPYQDKAQVIFSYEVGLTQWFLDKGFVPFSKATVRDVFALYRAKHPIQYFRRILFRRRKRKKNITEYFPEELLELGVPFLKLKVLEKTQKYVCRENIYRLLESYGYHFDRPS